VDDEGDRIEDASVSRTPGRCRRDMGHLRVGGIIGTGAGRCPLIALAIALSALGLTLIEVTINWNRAEPQRARIDHAGPVFAAVLTRLLLRTAVLGSAARVRVDRATAAARCRTGSLQTASPGGPANGGGTPPPAGLLGRLDPQGEQVLRRSGGTIRIPSDFGSPQARGAAARRRRPCRGPLACAGRSATQSRLAERCSLRMPASSQVLDPIQVTFDDERAVADAGLLLTGTLIGRLGLERTVERRSPVDTGSAQGPHCGLHAAGRWGLHRRRQPAACRVDRQDRRARHRRASTVGTWLRQLTFGHVRQLDAVTEMALKRAGRRGRGRAMQRCSSTSTRHL
jgi:hypothetical protein